MAEGKRSVLLYCDIIHTVEKLDDENAGKLFKHYLRYINDLNPDPENILVEIAFESIKQSLKRDLKKYKDYIEKQKINGKKGGRPKKTQKTQAFLEKPKKGDSDSDSDSDSEDVLFTTDKLKVIYLEDKKLKTAVCESLGIQETELIKKIDEFNNHLTTIGQHAKKISDYNSHFLSWYRKNPAIKNNTFKNLRDEARKRSTI